MKAMFFFLCVFLKKPVIWLLAGIMAVVVVFSFSTSSFMETLPCAFYSCDSSEEAAAISEYLVRQGFVLCDSEEEVTEMVRNASADTGLILYDGFAEKLRNDDLNSCAQIITSNRSMNTDTYKLIAAASIYREIMPIKAAAAATEMGIETDVEDILRYAEEAGSYLSPLEFEITSVSGTVPEEGDNTATATGVLSITAFILFGMLSVAMVRNRSLIVRNRFSSYSSWFLKCILPQSIGAGLILLLAGTAGLAVSHLQGNVSFGRVFPALLIYMAILAFFFALFSLIPLSSNILISILAFDAALGLVLCPLYSGTELLFRSLQPLRVFCVPYWMYLFFW